MYKKFIKQTFVFKEDLMNTPLIVSTINTEKGYVTKIENLPVETFRDGAYQQQILQVEPDKKTALKYHKDVIGGKA